MPFIDIIIYVALGIVSGLLTGLLGIGGGVITVPAFLLIFSFLGLHQNAIMHYSIGTSLAIIVVSSLTSLYLYNKKKGVMWRLFQYLLPGLIIGSVTGCIIAFYLSGDTLKLVFGCFAIALGIYLFFTKDLYLPIYAPKNIGFSFYGIIIGCLATMIGVGGGVIAMPFLIMIFKTPRRVLIGTASACTFFSALVGTLTYIVLGIEVPTVTVSLGYIYLPAFILVSVVSIIFVYFGVKIAQNSSTVTLRRIFAIALFATGLSMVI